MGRFARKTNGIGCKTGGHLSKRVFPSLTRSSFSTNSSGNVGSHTSVAPVTPFKHKGKSLRKKKLDHRMVKKISAFLKENREERHLNSANSKKAVPKTENEPLKNITIQIKNSSVRLKHSPIRFPASEDLKDKRSVVDGENICTGTSARTKDKQGLRNDTALMYKPGRKGPTVLWIPGSSRSLAFSEQSYVPFTCIVRTVHLQDALEILHAKQMVAKRLVNFSTLRNNNFEDGHMLSKLRVLWFGAECADAKESEHNWYGNVKFSLPVDILKKWKNCYMVEMVTTPTHTATRILMTNTDYSDELLEYDRYDYGRTWYVKDGVHYTLLDCSRYQNEGINKHGHILEFLIETSVDDEMMLLKESKISFVNHEDAQNMTVPHVCHRHQHRQGVCPTPFSAYKSARIVMESYSNIFGAREWFVEKLSDRSLQLYRQIGVPLYTSKNICFESDIKVLLDTDKRRIVIEHDQSQISLYNWQEDCYTDRSLCVKEWHSYDEQFINDFDWHNEWLRSNASRILRF